MIVTKESRGSNIGWKDRILYARGDISLAAQLIGEAIDSENLLKIPANQAIERLGEYAGVGVEIAQALYYHLAVHHPVGIKRVGKRNYFNTREDLQDAGLFALEAYEYKDVERKQGIGIPWLEIIHNVKEKLMLAGEESLAEVINDEARRVYVPKKKEDLRFVPPPDLPEKYRVEVRDWEIMVFPEGFWRVLQKAIPCNLSDLVDIKEKARGKAESISSIPGIDLGIAKLCLACALLHEGHPGRTPAIIDELSGFGYNKILQAISRFMINARTKGLEINNLADVYLHKRRIFEDTNGHNVFPSFPPDDLR